MWDYLLREEVSLVGLGAVSDSTATEFELTLLLTDLSSMALHSKEQEHHLQNWGHAVTSLIDSTSRTALSSEILQKADPFLPKTKKNKNNKKTTKY